MSAKTQEIIRAHEASGRYFEAGGLRSFALDHGSGETIVMLHGVPTSSFLYRKLVPALSGRFRAVAFDFPGLGLADRPEEFDYSWSGLARFTEGALDALNVDRCHLVVHDIGGPIGCEFAVRQPDRILSLTALNTMLNLGSFRRVWTMAPFAVRGLGEVALRLLPSPLAVALFYLQGVEDAAATPRSAAAVHHALLKRGDGGRAFLRIMRGFELTEEKESFLRNGLAARPYPAQVIWGAEDPALGEDSRLEVQEALRVDDPLLLPAKHFLQEDQAPALAIAIAAFAGRGSRPSGPSHNV